MYLAEQELIKLEKLLVFLGPMVFQSFPIPKTRQLKTVIFLFLFIFSVLMIIAVVHLLRIS